MAEAPLVVLVHGAWHGAWCWSALQSTLDARGIASMAVDLPGHGVSTEPLGDLAGDVAHLQRVVDVLDRPVVLVGHSYGGAVIGGVATDHLRHLVYVAAFCLDVGESVMGMAQSLPPAATALAGAMRPQDDGTALVDPAMIEAAFYAACPAGTAAVAAPRLCAQPFATLVQPAAHAAWKTVASTYVVCTQDQAVAPSHQEVMAQRCGTVVSLETDHSPFISAVEATADVIAGAALGDA
jgi:pimeloyl-ACP methyl ester carboxylesterase